MHQKHLFVPLNEKQGVGSMQVYVSDHNQTLKCLAPKFMTHILGVFIFQSLRR